MFKVNNKDTRATSVASFWFLLTLNIFLTLFSSVSIVNFEQVNRWLGHWFDNSMPRNVC